jgi:hypothetical protein
VLIDPLMRRCKGWHKLLRADHEDHVGFFRAIGTEPMLAAGDSYSFSWRSVRTISTIAGTVS